MAEPSELPTGTVTFLFTDIEGSTRLLREIGDRYAQVLEDHGRILREAIAGANGVAVGTYGDSFFAVFVDASDAVRAAVTAQRELAAHDWPHGDPVRVRMGLHTGQGRLGREGYVGLDVHRAARIEAAAHGGQVLLSDATARQVDAALPDGVAVRRVGEHRLKDLAEPERLHDLEIEGLLAEFPPPRAIDARPSNLPAEVTSFVGRQREIAEVERLLGSARLLTLTGPGGSGKTRLAVRAASRLLGSFEDGAWFVDLSSVSDPAVVPSTIAKVLGVPEDGARPIVDAIKDHLRDRELLLVVDNFEQVAAAAPVVHELLQAAPRVKVIVTSRIVLAIPGEQELVVPPLAPPDADATHDLTALRAFDAVRLFMDRARAVAPAFDVDQRNASAVAAITARLDGLPLAIELAATRTKVLSPQQMLERLTEGLAVLASRSPTVPDRQRTLRGAIAWSYDLLDEPDRRFFARLSIFSGGWTLAAADDVTQPPAIGLDALDALSSLVDRSLVRRGDTPRGEPRFSMLETIREFGQEQLQASGDLDLMLRRHGEHFLAMAVGAERHLTADDQIEWLDHFDLEHGNIREALRWAIETGRLERAQEAAGALWRFWQQRGHIAEGARWFDEVLSHPSGRAPTAARAKALIGAGGIAWWRRDRESAGRFYREALSVERELGDPARVAEALYNLAFVEAGEDIERAAVLLEESLELFRSVGDERGAAQVLAMLVIRDAQAGRWEQVASSLEELVAMWRRLGDRLHLAFDLVWLGFAYGRLGRREDGRAAAVEALRLFRSGDNATGLGIALSDLAFLAAWDGRHEDALRLAAASEAVKERVGGPPGGFAGILEGDPAEEARAHLDASVASRAWDEGYAMPLDEAIELAERA